MENSKENEKCPYCGALLLGGLSTKYDEQGQEKCIFCSGVLRSV